MISRRGFLRGLVGGAAIVAAPAIIREGFAMPVKAGLGEPSGLVWKQSLLEEPLLPIPEEYLRAWSQSFYTSTSIGEIAINNHLTALGECSDKITGSKGDMIIDSSEPISPEHLRRALDIESMHARGIPHISLDNDIMSRIQNPPMHPSYTAGHQSQTWHAQHQLHKWFTDNPRKLERIT